MRTAASGPQGELGQSRSEPIALLHAARQIECVGAYRACRPRTCAVAGWRDRSHSRISPRTRIPTKELSPRQIPSPLMHAELQVGCQDVRGRNEVVRGIPGRHAALVCDGLGVGIGVASDGLGVGIGVGHGGRLPVHGTSFCKPVSLQRRPLQKAMSTAVPSSRLQTGANILVPPSPQVMEQESAITSYAQENDCASQPAAQIPNRCKR